MGLWQGLHLHNGGLEEGGQGRSQSSPSFPTRGSGGAGSGHSLSATQLHTDSGRSLQCLTLVDTGEPSSNHLEHTLNSLQSLLHGGGVCLSGSSAWLFFVSCCFLF